ncbi:ABC transporter ATP-binding protein [Streptococcus loxodontisalivarius]|uniref:ATP-binding cassette subfamily C protein n=1 Tax=Streptococcus loxodontisalivarius TaxID=1349415 RepID=A0ABS2PPQ0_9STRE|nr:ABC transporter ATP-binding protein [Streptococcus loxodontisalivarius]MBM7642013.1 ATP-binding cassette subfamily C protein [Streptococcus loxodontisalivarius]
MKSLFHYFKGYIKETLLGPLFKLLEASFELLVPIIIATIVDDMIPKDNHQGLYLMILILFGLAVLGVCVSITAQYFSSKAAVGYTKKLSQDLFRKIMVLPKASRDRLTTSSLVTRLTSDTYQIQTAINQFLRLFLRAPIIVFGSIIMAYRISPVITLNFLGMVALLFLIIAVTSRILAPYYQKIRLLTDAIVTKTREQLQGIRVIRAFNQTDREISAFKQVNTAYAKMQILAANISSVVNPATFFVVNTTLVLVIWQGNGLISQDKLSQGMLIALTNYLTQILAELLKMTMLVTSLNQSFISAKRVQEVFDQEAEDLNQTLDSQSSTDLLIKAENLSFTYPTAGDASLKNLTFDLKKGQNMGIIGGTGSGKSTLVQLLDHLYETESQELLIFHNGHSPKSIAEWRSWLSLVPQKAELFKGSIRSNLTLGLDANLSDEELWWALDIAQASEFVREKDDQLDEEVEAFGKNFSGGQRQRLTIARAILRKAPFLILDDSTSALDYLTESKLLKAIREELADTSLIMISQRTNSLQLMDKILVLDKGNQLGYASHDQLLEDNETYQAIHYSQKGKEEQHEG